MNTHNLRTLLLLAATVAAAPGGPHAQTPANTPTFEVASVRPNKSGDPRASFGGRPGGQLLITNNTLRNIVRNAYGLQNYQIAGGPDWFDVDRFDIVAKAPDNAEPAQMLLMVQALLADRFALAVHSETREIPVYALVMARHDRAPGPQLRQATVDCAAMRAAARAPGALPPPRAPGARPICGIQTGLGLLMTSGSAMADIARNLSPFTGRMVLDKTGLAGTYDLDLHWTPDQMPPIPPGGIPPGAPPLPPADGPSIFTAVQEQLGLKLDSQRGPVEVLVIDRAERPMPD